METTNVAPMLEPNAEQMQQHLRHLFGGLDSAYQDAKIELAWTDSKDGKLKHAEIFSVEELDRIADRALEENCKPGQNVYIGQALRHPNTAPFGRASDSDFFALTAFYIDIDDDVIAAASKIYRARGCSPTAIVFTGRSPHPRAQMLWRLDAPVHDPNLCRRQNAILAKTLFGDSSVINPGRVLRLAGSIAWPRKTGRVLELREFRENDAGGPKSYAVGAIAGAFPDTQPELTAANVPKVDRDIKATSSATSTPPLDLNIGTSTLSVDTCIARIRSGNHWHDNMLRLVGHWIGRGWSDTEIAAAAEAMTLPGYTAEQTRQDVRTMIAGGRSKWNVPNPAITIDEKPVISAPPLEPAFLDSLNIAMLPRRRWLLGRALLRGHLTLLVAPAGVGKSTHGIARAVALVTGREITSEPVHETIKAWVYNTEDDSDELKRRLGAVLQHWSIPFAEVRNRIALNSGADRPLLLARADKSGMVVRLPDFDACITKIRDNEIGVFIVDPFVETHEVNENANEQIKVVAAMYREIARATNCAVLLVHHTAKPPQGASDGYAGNMNAARGASALVGVARVVQTLFGMSDKDADHYGVAPNERHLFLRLDDAKANLGLVSPDALWFRKVGVDLPNGDQVGVLEPAQLEAIDAEDESADAEFLKTIIGCLLARVKDDEITVSAAARLLAWSDDKRFAQYRQTDAKGHQRTSATLRRAVSDAGEAGIALVSDGAERGFVLRHDGSRTFLQRFERPFSNGSAQPENSPGKETK